MNYVLSNRETLRERHYIRKADPANNYWVDFSAGPLSRYTEQFGDAFCLVIAGDRDVEGDFFAIPYSFVADILKPETQTNDQNGRVRWVGNVINFSLRITNTNTRRDISEFYGRPELLDESSAVDVDSDDYENEYAINNRRAEVNQRVRQSAFRRVVLDNFKSQCCVTGLTESELLVASHIIPWSRRIDTRLDPANGLCLSVWIDKLFDRGFISFTDDLEIITAQNADYSVELQSSLEQLGGQQAQPPVSVPINPMYLQWHREYVFNFGTNVTADAT